MKIIIDITEKEMDAIEDRFFCELSKEKYKKIRPTLVRFWRKLCREVDKISSVRCKAMKISEKTHKKI